MWDLFQPDQATFASIKHQTDMDRWKQVAKCPSKFCQRKGILAYPSQTVTFYVLWGFSEWPKFEAQKNLLKD